MKRLIAAVLISVLHAACAFAQDQPVRYEHVMVPMKRGFFPIKLSTFLYTPPGQGRFPLVVLNHGQAPGTARQPDSRFCLSGVRRGIEDSGALPVR